jgi:hypothetical protein
VNNCSHSAVVAKCLCRRGRIAGVVSSKDVHVGEVVNVFTAARNGPPDVPPSAGERRLHCSILTVRNLRLQAEPLQRVFCISLTGRSLWALVGNQFPTQPPDAPGRIVLQAASAARQLSVAPQTHRL